MEKSKSFGETAEEYALKGYYILPIWPNRKRVFHSPQKNIPSNNIDVIRKWWEYCPQANIAIATSAKYSSLIIIDIDKKDGIDGEIAYKSIIEENKLIMPRTCKVKSGNGGYHLYYKKPKEIIVSSSCGHKLGIDIRAEKAYIVVPPSINENKKEYRWCDSTIEDIAIANSDVLKFVEIVNSKNEKRQ